MGDTNMNEKKETIFQDIYEAYVYAYPAVILELTRRSFLNASEDGTEIKRTNTYYHHANLADAAFKNVVAPNIDTVYSQAFLDLSGGALVLEKPKTDRYVSITFLDAYTNCENYVGTGADGNQAQNYLITGPDFVGEVPEGYIRIALPTNRNWSIVRTILYGREDIESVKELQSKIQLKPYGNVKQKVLYDSYHPELNRKPIQLINSLSLQEFFTIFNEILVGNPDKYAPVEKLARWEAYGIGAGKAFLYEESVKKIEKSVIDAFLKDTQRGQDYGVKRGGWSYSDFSIGVFQTNYMLRANVARNGLGANPITMCIYIATYLDAEGEKLDGNKCYRLHFKKGQLPPVRENGFWSITLYDCRERYLVDNEINRYGITDRDAWKENEDGSVDIYIQRKCPGEKQMANWLPSGSEFFNLSLRIYLPEDAVASGDWLPPVITSVQYEV